MIGFLVRRLSQSLVVLIGVTVVTFFMMHSAPGHPLQANPEMRLDPTAVERWLQIRNLDDPLPAQYLSWVSRVLRGDFGTSLLYNRPVAELIRERLPATLLLTVSAFILSFVLAIFCRTVIPPYTRTRSRGSIKKFIKSASIFESATNVAV